MKTYNMQFFTTTNILLSLILLILIITGAIFIYHIYIFIKNKGVPTISTFTKQRKLFLEHIHIPSGSSIVDLGCGYGDMLAYICKHYNISHALGVDLNGRATWRGNIKWHIQKQIHNKRHTSDTEYILKKQDIMETDISQTDYIYIYMIPEVMANLETYIQTNMKQDCILISNTFQFPNRKPSKIIYDEEQKAQLFIYHNSPLA